MDLNAEYQGLEFHRDQEESPIIIRLFEEETRDFTTVVTPEQIVQGWVAEAQGAGLERPIASIELEISI